MWTFAEAMTVGLAFVGLVGALTIDNQLTIIKSDCFERMAIGQKLNPKDVYLKLDLNTVPDCQRECTKDEDKCRSFSFGIGAKGNATCELSSKVIKETIDLKPIGTLVETDYDLYIKKLGCKIVIQHQPQIDLTTPNPLSDEIPTYGEDVGKPEIHQEEPESTPRANSQRVQTSLISIRPDPKRPSYTGLGPALGYFDGKKPYGHEFGGRPVRPYYNEIQRPKPYIDKDRIDYDSMPPFRPQNLNHPYNDYAMKPMKRPLYDNYIERPDDFDRPGSGYGLQSQSSGYGDRPNNLGPVERPKPMGYEGTSYENERPKPHYIDYYKPNSEFYDRPKPHYSERPKPDYNDKFRPSYDGPTSDSEYDRPNYYPERPKPESEYGFDRPNPNMRPMSDFGYGPSFDRPNPIMHEIERPLSDMGYGSSFDKPRPNKFENDRPRPDSGYFDRPKPDLYEHERPRPDSGYYDRPKPDMYENDRPKPDSGYSSDFDRPKPNNYGNERPKPDLGYGPSFDRPRPSYGSNMKPGYGNERPMDFESDRPDSGYGSSFERPEPNGYGNERPKPESGYSSSFDRPTQIDYERPKPDSYKPNDRPKPKPDTGYSINLDKPKPDSGYSSNNRPKPLNYNTDTIKPNSGYGSKPNNSDRPESGDYGDAGSKPNNNYGSASSDGYGSRPDSTYVSSENVNYRPNRPYDPNNPNYDQSPNVDYKETMSYKVTKDETRKGDKNGKPEAKPIITQRIGPHGETITSIITEIKPTCFRRALAGQRAIRSLVRRSVRCERLQECQQQCANEKRFFCEAFNFRLGPVIGANGDCDLLDIPVLGLDRWREIVSDPDFDVYERDRNSGPNCNALSTVKSHPPPPPSISDRYDRRPSYPEDVRRYDRRPYYDDRRTYDKYGDGYYKDEYHHRSQYYGSVKYLPLPKPQFDYKDKYYYDREKDRNFWGFEKWGSYGGVYGNFGKPASHYGKYDGNRRNDYLPAKAPSWQDGYHSGSYETRFPSTTSVSFGKPHQGFRPITTARPWTDYYNYGSYYNGGHEIRHPPSTNGGYHYDKPHKEYGLESPNYLPATGKPDFHQPKPNFQSLLPPKVGPNIITENTFYSISDDVVEHKRIEPPGYDFLKDECSLRTATGFKLHKTSVRKLYQVPDIYECEMLCFTESDFNCLSYAFRYTSNAKAQNCYLSHKSYKALDFYTDLEPNRDFDVYTMNNLKKCTAKPRRNDLSDCFWHVRSGLRLDQSIVRDTVNVKSVADCELECLRSSKFLCRSFSFRYGSPVIDNCQLTDWPFMELDSQTQLNPEQGFDIYERGSFGYGCEPNHFSIRGKEEPVVGSKTDQLCYVGYGKPAKLLPQAIRKSIFVNSELDCKLECTKSREQTLLHCMSFSFRNNLRRGESNCDLSDIHQRDLVGKVDFIYDDNSWLFAWDSDNPECVPIHKVAPNHGRENDMDIWRYNALDTWRVYSVSGYPCKRGTSCKENREAGFWYCELEGGDEDIWDYCCRPSHQCGYSEGFAYQWCYVGPDRTQWRKCSERYYPYLHNNILDHNFSPKPYIPDSNFRPDTNFRPDPVLSERPHFRPNRPLALPAPPPRRPSLNEYEQKFNMQFLDPPKPGGFGEPRRWPVSYLHKEMPQGESNTTELKFDRMRSRQNIAIHNLIDIIKSKDINNIEYQITNKTSKMNDILLVKIPLPTNFTESSSSKPEKMRKEEKVSLSEPIDLNEEAKNTTGIKIKTSGNKRQGREYSYEDNFEYRPPTFRRGFVTRTNVTDYGHRF